MSLGRVLAARAEVCAGVQDRRLLTAAVPLAILSLLVFGIVSAIIPNPVFGRSVPPTDSSIAVWLLSAPLMGIVLATYLVPAPTVVAPLRPVSLVPAGGPVTAGDERAEGRSSTLAGLAGFGAFLAIGCPVCNKVALVLLGASGALSIWAPIQPIVGLASLLLLAATAAWRLRMRANGNACSTPPVRA